MSTNGAPIRPMAAPNGGRGKELPHDQAGYAMPAQPRNRRERRALAAWKRKQAVISHHGARKNRPTGGDHE